MRVDEFWLLTPREALLLFNDYLKQNEADEKAKLINMVSSAWYTANFGNAKKLPNLNKILKDIFKEPSSNSKSKKRMSKEEIERHYQEKVVNK